MDVKVMAKFFVYRARDGMDFDFHPVFLGHLCNLSAKLNIMISKVLAVRAPFSFDIYSGGERNEPFQEGDIGLVLRTCIS